MHLFLLLACATGWDIDITAEGGVPVFDWRGDDAELFTIAGEGQDLWTLAPEDTSAGCLNALPSPITWGEVPAGYVATDVDGTTVDAMAPLEDGSYGGAVGYCVSSVQGASSYMQDLAFNFTVEGGEVSEVLILE